MAMASACPIQIGSTSSPSSLFRSTTGLSRGSRAIPLTETRTKWPSFDMAAR
jgi:hypothetical protein